MSRETDYVRKLIKAERSCFKWFNLTPEAEAALKTYYEGKTHAEIERIERNAINNDKLQGRARN